MVLLLLNSVDMAIIQQQQPGQGGAPTIHWTWHSAEGQRHKSADVMEHGRPFQAACGALVWADRLDWFSSPACRKCGEPGV
ncbi:MAG: hypothetical protein ACRDRL_33140 [Sciscionella sp.]